MPGKIIEKKERVVVALSGGVDSAVAAALLKEQGYEVVGVFMKCWSDTKDSHGHCCWRDDHADAVKVAKTLGIALRSVDFEQEYKKYVFSYFLREYEAGRTPNPDILCNKVIKFNALLQYARTLGANWLATGHHVRKKTVTRGGKTIHHLLAGKDSNKDQSYFLSELDQSQLATAIFPIGKYTKDEVRAMAHKYGIHVADKRSSRGICFIGQHDFKEFLQKYIKPKPGNIINLAGKVMGRHEGLPYYTIGQRYGLKISAQTPNSLPYYVTAKDQKENTLIVDQGLMADSLMAKKVLIEEVHWISGTAPKLPLKAKARLRYRQPLQVAKISKAKSGLLITFSKPQRAATPGQIAAIYKGQELLGSGTIEKAT